ncbi:Aspartyl aminopeptidase [Anaerosphaera aminiphila DSM 21120]|uniref:M18 family aminopeptidase n=1 Tax=Anaerosphaera aminiphila DSM 21120 TaxID=1120995 RepID=A0A1M5RN41_9FIRM|nr:aminopeptidase [Anaerosphaera aminiphila]SHH27675.1 Aspartyl aminopeptidase [Anaerosphaera aminiphila DSM 21120]
MNLEDLELKQKSIWQLIDKKEYDNIFDYCEGYKDFLDEGKTERESCSYIIKKAEKSGFIPFEEAVKSEVKQGDKIYYNNKNKSVILFVMGENLEDGMRVVGSHIDVPRLDIKQKPLYEDSELALLKTHYYGGVKKYQWPTIPLAIHGIVINEKNETINIKIGEDESDPVFYINDLLPHLSADQNKKSLAAGVTGESLNIVVGHSSYGISDEKNPIKKAVLKYLNEKYSIKEEDFLIAELEVVPATKARDVGFDRAMIAAHGHDDRICSYANLEAILTVENPKISTVGLFVDKEEIGSVGNTSMSAKFFENFIAEILNTQKEYSDIKLRRALANSKVLSADVTVAMDPSYKEVLDEKNAAYVGYGISMAKYTGARGKSGSNDANTEFLAEIRDMFNNNGVIWQTGELGKVDQGGGGTIAYILAEYGAEVVDMGTAMLSMHAPVELASKADAYMTYKAYKVFFNN